MDLPIQLATFIKIREKIESATQESTFKSDRKKMRMCKDGERNMVEEGLFVWFKQARSLNIPTQGKQSRL
jgi:hypothetical protein